MLFQSAVEVDIKRSYWDVVSCKAQTKLCELYLVNSMSWAKNIEELTHDLCTRGCGEVSHVDFSNFLHFSAKIPLSDDDTVRPIAALSQDLLTQWGAWGRSLVYQMWQAVICQGWIPLVLESVISLWFPELEIVLPFNISASESVLLGGMKNIFHKEGSTRQRSFSALCRVLLPQRIPPPSGNLIEIKLLPPGEIKNKQTTTPAAKLWSSLQLICSLPDGPMGLSDQQCILS